MQDQLTLKIIITKPYKGVVHALQKGSGNNYESVQKQTGADADLVFTFSVTTKTNTNNEPDFKGPFVQGPVSERFVYIGVGNSAGQVATAWNRRMKIPLRGITSDMLGEAQQKGHCLQTIIPGVGKDGGPNCATIKPFDGWVLAEEKV